MQSSSLVHSNQHQGVRTIWGHDERDTEGACQCAYIPHHPFHYHFHEEARLIKYGKCAWPIGVIWNSEFHVHKFVISFSKDDESHFLLGGAHRFIASIFNFTRVTKKSVASDRANDKCLLRMVQFSEPVSAEWQTIPQTVIFAHFIDSCEPIMSAATILHFSWTEEEVRGGHAPYIVSNRFK